MVYTQTYGFYQWTSITYGHRNTNFLKSWVNTRKKIVTLKQQLIFLLRCRRYDVFPPHICNLKIGLNLHSNSVNKKFNQRLKAFKVSMLNFEIRDLNFNLNFLNKSLQSIEKALLESLPNDMVYKFFDYNEHKISRLNYIKRVGCIKKFNNLLRVNNIALNPLATINNSKWLINISNKKIPKGVSDIFSLGDNFGLPLDNGLNNDRTITLLETVKNIEVNYNKIPNTMIDTTRNNIANSIQKFLCTSRHINHIDRFFTNGFEKCRRFLHENNDLLVTRADKGQATVVMNKIDYIDKMLLTLNDDTTYKMINKDPIKRISSKIHTLVRSWLDNGLIDDATYRHLNCTNAILPRCYGLPKIHKVDVPLRIIVSSLGSPVYNLAYFIHKILYDSIKKPKSHIKDGWSLAKIINNTKINENEILISLDVSSLFTNIPKKLVITAIENRWNDIANNTVFSLDQFIYAVETILDTTSFSFNGNFYEQIFGSPMGSPLSPILADMVMDDLESDCLKRLDFKLTLYYRYVDDILAVIPSDKIDLILNIFNSYHDRLNFTHELENNNSISFLNTKIIRKDNTLISDWYHKPTFSGRYTNYFSSHSLKYKINTINNLVDHAILLSNEQFHKKNIELVKQILTNNCFPTDFTNQIIIKRLGHLKQNINKNDELNVNRKNNFDPKRCIVLPYVKGFSDFLKNSLSKVGVNVLYSVPKKLNTLIKRGKDKITKLNKTEVVYQIKCKNCDFSYVGQTKRHLITRIKEHKNNIKMHDSNHSVLTKHRLEFEHDFDWDNPTILHTEKHKRKRELAEMFYIKKTKNTLNAQKDTDNLNVIYDKVIRLV